MKGVELEIFWHTDETRALEDLGIDHPLEDCTTRKVSFYRIDALSPYDGKYCKIWLGSDSFICTMPYEKAKRFIEMEL